MNVNPQPDDPRVATVRRALLAGMLALSASLGVAATAGASTRAAATSGRDDDERGAIYTLTNAVSGNAVAVFARAADGRLTAAGAATSSSQRPLGARPTARRPHRIGWTTAS